MDFGRDNSSAIIANPAIGHSPNIDEKALAWGGVQDDILYYLSDISRLEEFADKAANAEQLALLLEPFLDNAQKYFEAMQKLADGQITWTELRKQFGSKVANAIAKIRKLNAEFGSEMELLDAKDRASMLRIEAKRQNGLTEIAHELQQDLQSQMWAHENKMGAISNKGIVAEKRQSIQGALRAKRQELLNRATNGTNQGMQDTVPVLVGGGQSNTSNSNSNSNSNTSNRGFGGWFANLFKF
jgi:hypothetical protein